jgi:DNA-binding NtrC family response regulator
VYLPRQAAAQATAPAQPAGADLDARPRGGQTILFVDDEAPIRKIARTVLERQGYRVRLAADGAEAVAAFHEEAASTDLVIVDLTMPRLTGTEVVQALRAVRPDLRIILSTGHLSGDALALEGEPSIAVLHKPYTPALLVQAVRRALETGGAGEPDERN